MEGVSLVLMGVSSYELFHLKANEGRVNGEENKILKLREKVLASKSDVDK